VVMKELHEKYTNELAVFKSRAAKEEEEEETQITKIKTRAEVRWFIAFRFFLFISVY
jgi:hypothetical protein